MKLYTEEQVKSMLDRARMHKQDDSEMFSNEYLLSKEIPIELPSNEEIEEAFTRYNQIFTDRIVGAKWVIEQIKKEKKL